MPRRVTIREEERKKQWEAFKRRQRVGAKRAQTAPLLLEEDEEDEKAPAATLEL